MQNKMSRRNVLYLALAILVSVCIWIYVDVAQDDRSVTKTLEGIPVEYQNEDGVLADRGLMLLEDGTDTTIDLTVRGTRWNIARLDPDSVRVTVDLSDVTTTGSQRVKYSVLYPDGFSSVISLADASSYMARVNIGELNTRTVEIRTEYVGSVAEGYTAGELQLSPATLEIRGQEKELDKVSYAKVTINLDDASATFSESLSYQLYDENDELLTDTGIRGTVDQIQATLPVNVTKDLKLVMDFTESPGARVKNVKWTIEPASITVMGDAEKLRDVSTITLAKLDLTKLDSSTLYSYSIPLPEGCENLSGETTATLRASFTDMTAASLTTSHYTITNLPEGKEAEVLTENWTVKVFGTSADVGALTGDSLTAVIDLTDYSAAAGSYTVPVTIKAASGDIGISGSYQARVTIRETVTEPETPTTTPEESEDTTTTTPSEDTAPSDTTTTPETDAKSDTTSKSETEASIPTISTTTNAPEESNRRDES